MKRLTVILLIISLFMLLSCGGRNARQFNPNPKGPDDLAGSIISCGLGSSYHMYFAEHHPGTMIPFENTEERARFVAFSEPYITNCGSCIGRKADFYDKGPLLARLKESIQLNLVEENRWKMVLNGFLVTIEISIYSIIASILVGAGICAMRMSRRKWLQSIARALLNLVRRIPLLIMLMLMLYVVFASVRLNPMIIAVLSFALYFGAYFSESFRTGIESIQRGQWEAGYAMGLSPVATFRKIILPQALLRIIPVFKGLMITLIKSTSIVGYIAIFDMTKASDMIRSRTFDAFFPLLLTAALYLILSWLFGLVLDTAYKRLTPKRRTL